MVINIIILLVLLTTLVNFRIKSPKRKENLISRPTNDEIPNMVKKIMDYKEFFTNKPVNINVIKRKIPWMDIVLYEDIRKIILNNDFSEKSIKKILIL